MTTNEPTVVAICGSLRAESRTRVALTAGLEAAAAAGASTALLDLREYDLRGVYGDGGSAADASALRETVADADGLLVGTPTYHDSYSGSLKVALDHCGRDELEETAIGLLEVAGGRFPGSACSHLRAVFREVRAEVLSRQVTVPAASETVTPQAIADAEIDERVRALGRALARRAGDWGARADGLAIEQ